MGLTQITTGGVDDNINIDSNTLKVDGTNNRVGIGTAAPSSSLHISSSEDKLLLLQSSDANAYLAFQDSSSSSNAANRVGTVSDGLYFNTGGGGERMRIDSSGRVGIGIASPTADGLHIVNSSQPDLFMGTSTNAIGFKIVYNNTDSVLGNATSTPLRFVVGNAERMRIDSSGRLMIGTSTQGNVSADDLTIATSSHTGMTIRSGTSHQCGIYLADGTSGDAEYRGYFLYDHNGDHLRIGTAGIERMRIDSSGNLLINTTSTLTQSAELRVSGSSVATAEFYNAGGCYNTWSSGGTPTSRGYIGVANQLISGGSGSDFCVRAQNNLVFNAGGTGNELMRLDTNGRLGIGSTCNQNEKFLVHGNDNSIYVPFARSSSKWITVHSGGTDPAFFCDTTGNIRFGMGTSRNSFTNEYMRLTNGGGLYVGQTAVTSNSGNPNDGIHVGNAGTHIGDTHIGIGDSASTARWRIQTGSYNLSFAQNTGSGNHSIRARINNSSGTYTVVSDQRAKKNITNSSYGIDELKQLRPVSYYMNDQDESTDKLNLGFIAQEVLSVIPEAVDVPADPEEMQGLESSALIPVLVSSLQEAVAKIETLEAKVAALEAAA